MGSRKKRGNQRLPWSAESSTSTDFSLQQLAPYIGRIKTTMARYLIRSVTKKGDVVVDPFCGSGVILLEGLALDRHVVGCDWNAYGAVLSKGKLKAPKTLEAALRAFETTWKDAQRRIPLQDLRQVPRWVRAFFHKETLREILALRDACVERNQHFLLSCLLGILHHQRPGFLSFPSSHLVPYLRSRKFPRTRFPKLYEKRDVASRMKAKITRSYRRPIPTRSATSKVYKRDARHLPPPATIDAIVTSPPYMNALDYVRDNRLRLWFIDKKIEYKHELKMKVREQQFKTLLASVCSRLAPNIKRGGVIALVVGDVQRSKKAKKTDRLVHEVFAETSALNQFVLTKALYDKIPDVRRARRNQRGTKRESILIYKRVTRGKKYGGPAARREIA